MFIRRKGGGIYGRVLKAGSRQLWSRTLVVHWIGTWHIWIVWHKFLLWDGKFTRWYSIVFHGLGFFLSPWYLPLFFLQSAPVSSRWVWPPRVPSLHAPPKLMDVRRLFWASFCQRFRLIGILYVPCIRNCAEWGMSISGLSSGRCITGGDCRGTAVSSALSCCGLRLITLVKW